MQNSTEKSTVRSAVITGAGRGIGRSIAVRLASEGMNVCINYAGNEKTAQETVLLCRSANPAVQVISFRADVSDSNQADALIAFAADMFGGVDVLINNAGITRDRLLMGMKDEDFDSVITANLRGAFLCCRAVSRSMIRHRFGRIINISSVVGLHGNAGQANYAASKAGLIGLTKSLAKEWASRNITVNAIAPGFISTDMTAAMSETAAAAALSAIPMGRAGLPEDIANAAAFLASDESGYITGQVLCVDGGMAV